MKKLKLSPWHDGSVKPVHVGLYQSLYTRKDEVLWRYWNGKKWGWGYENKRWAISWRNAEGATQTDPWRGILK